MAPRKPPSPAPITLSGGLGPEGKGYSWMSFTRFLLPVLKDLPPAQGGFGQWEMAAAAAVIYGIRNRKAAEETCDAARLYAEPGKLQLARLFRTIWTGEADPAVPLSNLAELHENTRALWAEWSKTDEGVAALASRGVRGTSGGGGEAGAAIRAAGALGRPEKAKPLGLVAAAAAKDRNELARLEERAALIRARTAARLAQLAGDE